MTFSNHARRQATRSAKAWLGGAIVLALVCSAPSTLAQSQSDGSGADVVANVDATGGAIHTSGATVVIRGEASSISAAGALVDIDATVSGRVEAGGAQVSVSGKIDGDLRAGGGLVETDGTIGGDVYLGGAVVRFDGTAAKSVNAGGATVQIGENATIDGDLTAGAASLLVSGTVSGAADLNGAAIVFNGDAGGTLTATGDAVVIGSTAKIAGDLVVRSYNEPTIEIGASITGQVRLEEPRQWWALSGWLWALICAVAVAAGGVLAGAVLLLIGRGVFEEGLSKATFHPISSGLIGLAFLVLLPIVALVLMTTVIGLSLGVAFLLVVPLLLIAGHAIVIACIGVWIIDRDGEPHSAGQLILFMVVGAIVMAIVWLIPWVGAPIALLAMLVGTGAYLRSLGGRLRHRSATVG